MDAYRKQSGKEQSPCRLGLIISLHDFCFSRLEFEHLKEIGKHGTGAVEPVKISFRNFIHNFDAHLAIIFHQFPKSLSTNA